MLEIPYIPEPQRASRFGRFLEWLEVLKPHPATNVIGQFNHETAVRNIYNSLTAIRQGNFSLDILRIHDRATRVYLGMPANSLIYPNVNANASVPAVSNSRLITC